MSRSSIIVAPQSSNEINTLLSALEGFGDYRESARNLMWLINAQPRLLGFLGIVKNLGAILEFMEKNMKIDLSCYGIAEWQPLVEEILEEKEFLSNKIGSGFAYQPKDSKDHPLLNKGLTRHPMHAALFNTQEKEHLREHYLGVQAQSLIAHVLVMRGNIPRDKYEAYAGKQPLLRAPRAADPMGRGLRMLSKAEAEPELMCLDPYKKPQKFVDDLNNYERRLNGGNDSDGAWRRDKFSREREQKLKALVYFTQRAHGRREWVRRQGAGGGDGERAAEAGFVDSGWFLASEELDFGAGSEPGGEFRLDIPADVDGQIGIDGRLKEDGFPFEGGADGILVESYGKGSSGQGTVAERRLTGKTQVKHLQMANQMLPWDYANLTCQEIHNVINGLLSEYEKCIRGSYENLNIVELETIIAVLISFATGSSIDRVLNVKVVADGKFRDYDLALFINQVGKISEWQIKSVFPNYKTSLREPETIVRRRVEHLLLPDLIGVDQLIISFMKKRGKKLSSRSQIFTRSEAQYKKEFKRLRQIIGESERVTLGKIQKVVFQRCVYATGDIADAVALTGNPHRLSATKCHYYAPNIYDLVQCYLGIIDDLSKKCEFRLKHSPEAYAVPDSAKSFCLGSRACAKHTAVVSEVRRLKEKLKSAAHYSTWEEFIQYHNLYTFYTVQMVAFATGLRAVTDPIPDGEAIDRVGLILAISDKDDANYSKSRITHLPSQVLEQLRYFEEHCRTVWAAAGQRLKIEKPITGNPRFLIKLGARKKLIEPIKPSTLQSFLDDFLGLPANAHRRFLRTELRERGCPAEVVDAFMGHASLGEEPWGRFSALAVERYKGGLQQYLFPLFDSLGWVAIQSRLVKGGASD